MSFLGRFLVKFGKSVLQLRPEVSDQTLDWPGSSISQSTDGVTLDLLGQLPDHVDLLGLGVALGEPPHHGVHPVDALPAGSALTTGLVFVEERQPGDGLHHVGLLVHHDDGCSAQASLSGHQGIKIHHDVVADLESELEFRGRHHQETSPS